MQKVEIIKAPRFDQSTIGELCRHLNENIPTNLSCHTVLVTAVQDFTYKLRAIDSQHYPLGLDLLDSLVIIAGRQDKLSPKLEIRAQGELVEAFLRCRTANFLSLDKRSKQIFISPGGNIMAVTRWAGLAGAPLASTRPARAACCPPMNCERERFLAALDLPPNAILLAHALQFNELPRLDGFNFKELRVIVASVDGPVSDLSLTGYLEKLEAAKVLEKSVRHGVKYWLPDEYRTSYLQELAESIRAAIVQAKLSAIDSLLNSAQRPSEDAVTANEAP